MDLSIIIPCYNESENLPALTKMCAGLITSRPNAEIILVDNGSTDYSAEIMAQLIQKASLSNLRSFRVPVNKGYGYGITQGLKYASGKVLCWTHADLQTDIADCFKAYDLWLKDGRVETVVKGKRQGRGLFDEVFTLGMQWYVWYKLHSKISDINAQPKLFTKTFFLQIEPNCPKDFSLDLFLLIQAKKFGQIIDFPVRFHNRRAGLAKGGSGNLSLKLKLAKRSLNFINSFKS